MLEPGTLALIKTSGERVLILERHGDQCIVRRPVNLRGAVLHMLDTFHAAELETEDQKLASDIALHDKIETMLEGNEVVDVFETPVLGTGMVN